MGLFDRFRGGGDIGEMDAPTVTPNRTVRRGQMLQLETAILDLMDRMQESPHWRNPGWQAQVLEFYDILAQLRALRPREFEWSELVDLAFEVRPVMRPQMVTPELAGLGEAQDRMMTIARALSEPRPDEVA